MSNYRNLAETLLLRARQITNNHRRLNLVQTIVSWRNRFYFGLYVTTPEYGRNVVYLLLSKKAIPKGVRFVLQDNHQSLESHILADQVDIPHHSAYLVLDDNGIFTIPKDFALKKKLRELPPLLRHARLDWLGTYS